MPSCLRPRGAVFTPSGPPRGGRMPSARLAAAPLSLLFWLSLLLGCSSPAEVCDRLGEAGTAVEHKVTRCVVGRELRLGLLDDLAKYRTACKAAALLCGADALTPLSRAIDCIERSEPCSPDPAAQAASADTLERCRTELRSTPPDALHACLR